MTTDIIESPNLKSRISNHDEALTGSLNYHVIARICDLTFVPNQQPVSRENPLLLCGEYFG